MMLIEETPVSPAALPVEEFKAHLRLGSGFAPDDVQDAVLVGFLRAAVVAIEARTGKILIERDFILSVNEWQSQDSQVFPVAPVRAVTMMTSIDRTGVRSDVASDLFWLERDGHRPRVRSVGQALPAIPVAGGIEVSFQAGFGPFWADVPADLVQAVMLLAAHYYEFRQETTLSEGCMPFGVTSLIERYRVLRLGGRTT
ncbi:MAG: head-tail connector protein [Pseudomonadota bacterium]